MKAYVGQVLLVMALAIISVSLPLFLVQTKTWDATYASKANGRVLAGEALGGNQGFPVTLRIPSINVYTSIESVGVTPTGGMEVPKNAKDVGWFNLGPRPGEPGSAVIDGHFDNVNGQAAVFTNLYKLKAGDKIYVEDDRGISIVFVVKGNRLYDPGFASDVFGSSDGSHLNLVTCDGVWDGVKKSYSKRLVVFSDISI